MQVTKEMIVNGEVTKEQIDAFILETGISMSNTFYQFQQTVSKFQKDINNIIIG